MEQWSNTDDGFTYRGKHISEFGITYIASPEDIGTFGGKLRVEAETPDGMDGGYWIDTTVEPKVFKLNCLYEDVKTSVLHAIRRWFDRRQEGDLIFDDRPYLAYKVRPTANIVFTDYPRSSACEDGDLHSGTFTAELTAYDPFARVIPTYIPTNSASNVFPAEALATVSNELMVLPENRMPAIPTTSTAEFFMYNCGNEYAHTIIQVAGQGNLTITNVTTGQVCKIVGMTDAATTNQGKWIEIDSATGRCTLTSPASSVLDYSFHDQGYIVISPCAQFARNVIIVTAANSNIISSEDALFEDWMKGMYVYLGGSWREITAIISAEQARIDRAVTSAQRTTSDIVVMNRIQISDTATLSKLVMTCTPRAQ